MISASGEVGGYRRQIGLSADLEYYIHADDDVEKEVTMEEPEAGVGSPKS